MTVKASQEHISQLVVARCRCLGGQQLNGFGMRLGDQAFLGLKNINKGRPCTNEVREPKLIIIAAKRN